MDVYDNVARRFSRLLRQEDGPSATEYAILLAVIVLVAVAAIRGIGERMYAIYESVNSVMPG